MAWMFRTEVLTADEGTDNMKNIAHAVQEGANAYLTRQFRTLGIFAAVAFVALLALPADDIGVRIGRSIVFLFGAGFSAAVGYLGMSLAVQANLRVAAAANTVGRDPAMKIGFRTGAMVGMLTVGLGLLGASVVVLIFKDEAPHVLEGFGFGAALLAMFMRVGGGIFTKAADVGADLVGKVEQNIPEDDPRNAATIADNVGDNVGDCAGMAADLFESYAVTLVAALILGSQAFGDKGLVFPLLIPAIGALTAVLGVYLTVPRARRERPDHDQPCLLHLGRRRRRRLGRSPSFVYLPSSFADFDERHGRATCAGAERRPAHHRLGRRGHRHRDGRRHPGPDRLLHRHRVQARQGRRQDLAHRRGHRDPLRPLGRLRVRRLHDPGDRCRRLRRLPARWRDSLTISLFAVALAGCGLLTTVGVIVAMDTFGPVSDNAQGIAEMSGDVSPEGAQILTELDAVGNTTKAITKGIAIATAVLAATALFGSYSTSVARRARRRPTRADEFTLADFFVFNPAVLVGVLLGAAVVFLFSGLAINAVGRAAGAVVFEVRRQFRDIPGIMEGTGRPEYGKVVDIVTKDSLRELVTPGLLAVLAPIAVGFGLGVATAGRLPRRCDRHRHPDGRLPGQLGWCLGQRQEAGRGRPPRRQGLAGARGDHHR